MAAIKNCGHFLLYQALLSPNSNPKTYHLLFFRFAILPSPLHYLNFD